MGSACISRTYGRPYNIGSVLNDAVNHWAEVVQLVPEVWHLRTLGGAQLVVWAAHFG